MEVYSMHILRVKTIDGTWVDIPAIIGPQGPQGETGPMGPQGPKGEPGIVGETGVYVGTTEPSNSEVSIWINPEEDDGTNVYTKEETDAAINQAVGIAEAALDEIINGGL